MRDSFNRLRSLYTNQKYFMVTSTYQTVVLLQFNSSGDSLSYADLSVGTGINDDMLKGVLGLLCKQRVIDLKDDMYELNLGELEMGSGGLGEEASADEMRAWVRRFQIEKD